MCYSGLHYRPGGGGHWVLTDGSFVGPWVVDFVVADGLGPVHGLVKHHHLELLLLGELLLHRVHTVCLVEAVLGLVLGVFEVAIDTHGLILLLDEAEALVILEVALLLVGLNGDVSVDAVVVFLLLGKHS